MQKIKQQLINMEINEKRNKKKKTTKKQKNKRIRKTIKQDKKKYEQMKNWYLKSGRRPMLIDNLNWEGVKGRSVIDLWTHGIPWSTVPCLIWFDPFVLSICARTDSVTRGNCWSSGHPSANADQSGRFHQQSAEKGDEMSCMKDVTSGQMWSPLRKLAMGSGRGRKRKKNKEIKKKLSSINLKLFVLVCLLSVLFVYYFRINLLCILYSYSWRCSRRNG